MVGHGGSSAGSYLADPTSPIPSHCASIVVTSTVRVKFVLFMNTLAVVTFDYYSRCGPHILCLNPRYLQLFAGYGAKPGRLRRRQERSQMALIGNKGTKLTLKVLNF